MRVSMVGLAAMMAAGLATAAGWAQCQQERVTPEDATAGFGADVAVSGEVMLVGAPSDAEIASGRGAAYVFRRIGDTWVQEKKILPPEDVVGISFGLDVDLDGDTALIGAYRDFSSGAVYVYRCDGTDWVLETTLTAPEPEGSDQFGGDVALDGDVAVVGARYEDGELGLVGAAYVYRRTGTTWTLSEDCNDDGRPDECDQAYAVDDGDAEVVVGFHSAPGRTLWMNGFTVAPGERTLIALGVVWFEAPPGRPGAIMLYEDPNDDGNPNDARLVLSVDIETAPSEADE